MHKILSGHRPIFFLAWGHLKQCDWLVMALKGSAVRLAVLHLLAELGTMN